jgi:hypothetical protein
MPILRYLQHGLTGGGLGLQVADFVPDTHPLRQWADTCPWAALVAVIDRSCAQRFPKATTRGRPPISTRVVGAWALLQHALAGSDEQLGSRWRTDVAVRSACGSGKVQVDGSQEPVVRPEVGAHVRRRLDAPWMEALLVIQVATAMEDGRVRPAPLVVATWPREPGSQRVNAAATWSKAPQKSSRSASR